MLEIDGSMGEGGGQVLRTSLALSLATGRPFRMTRIRAGRAKPGLLRQHLTAVKAATRVGNAEVRGDELGSGELEFRPGPIAGGHHEMAVGSAGSAMLVAQTVLPALVAAGAGSRLVVEGGTHNPMAPPFDFLARSFLPLLARMGARVEASLERHGFFPAGGGRVDFAVEPGGPLRRLDLTERGEPTHVRATAILSALPRRVGLRELEVVAARMGWTPESLEVVQVDRPKGPGNVLLLELGFEHVTTVVVGFGEKGLPAETLASRVCDRALAHLASGVPVCEHLADQLILPMALAGGGSFVTGPLSRHTETQRALVPRFLDVAIRAVELCEERVRVEVESTG